MTRNGTESPNALHRRAGTRTTADRSKPDWSVPLAPLAEWMKSAERVLEESPVAGVLEASSTESILEESGVLWDEEAQALLRAGVRPIGYREESAGERYLRWLDDLEMARERGDEEEPRLTDERQRIPIFPKYALEWLRLGAPPSRRHAASL